jgi:hypothetical protein
MRPNGLGFTHLLVIAADYAEYLRTFGFDEEEPTREARPFALRFSCCCSARS